MLPAADLSEILTNLSALNLQPTTAAQILAAVLAPLLRSADPDPLPRQRAERPRRRPRRTARSKPRGSSRKRKYKRHAPSEARERALAALRANPDRTPTEIAKIAKVSRATVVNARTDLAKEARKQARKTARTRETSTRVNPPDRRERAQRFLKDTLAGGPKSVSAVEQAASRAHIDERLLEQARADLGVVTSRANTGSTLSVQWSLPG